MENVAIREKLKQLNITEETICLINEYIVDLNLDEQNVTKLLTLLERCSLQHYIRELLRKDMLH